MLLRWSLRKRRKTCQITNNVRRSEIKTSNLCKCRPNAVCVIIKSPIRPSNVGTVNKSAARIISESEGNWKIVWKRFVTIAKTNIFLKATWNSSLKLKKQYSCNKRSSSRRISISKKSWTHVKRSNRSSKRKRDK